jgi:hypothetical protein
MSGFGTLLEKELLRFWKVSVQTVAAPVLTAVLYLVVFAYALEGRVRVHGELPYTAFLVPGLVMMSVLQNAFANSSSSLVQSKITGNIVFILLPPISYLEFFAAYVLASVARGLVVGAGVLGVDASRIAVGGDSAGGNLAAVVCLLARDSGAPALCFQLLIYPATDQRCAFGSHARNGEGYLLTREGINFFRAAYLPHAKDYDDWRASPLLAASHAKLPPAFVLTAGYDPLVDEGRAYAERLAAAGVEVAYQDYPDMVHGFVLFGGVLDTANAAIAECCRRIGEGVHRLGQ